jgi:hypothetical protein
LQKPIKKNKNMFVRFQISCIFATANPRKCNRSFKL